MGDRRGAEPRLRVRSAKALSQTPSGPQSETIGRLRTQSAVRPRTTGGAPHADRFPNAEIATRHLLETFPRTKSKQVPTATKNSGYCSQGNIRTSRCQTKNRVHVPGIDGIREAGGIGMACKSTHAEDGLSVLPSRSTLDLYRNRLVGKTAPNLPSSSGAIPTGI
jgi:hypothetical protein